MNTASLIDADVHGPQAATQPMHVAVIGAGGMGTTVVEHLESLTSVKTVSVYDICAEKLKNLKGDKTVAVSDLDTILRDSSIELLFITTPNATHKELVLQGLEAGKAILCEKPIATDLEDARLMIDAAERCGGFLQIGFELRYSHLFTKIKEWIMNGSLGEIVNTNCQYTCSEYAGSDSWRVRETTGGGMFGEKLSHYVDLPRWWVGGDVVSVYSACAPNVIPYYERRDNFHTTYRFAHGAVSHLSFNIGVASTFRGDPLQNAVSLQKNDGHMLRYLVCGTKGVAIADVFGRRIARWVYEETKSLHECELAEDITWPESEDHFYFHNTFDQTKDVVHRVAAGLPPRISPRDALATMELSFAAELSANADRVIVLSEGVLVDEALSGALA